MQSDMSRWKEQLEDHDSLIKELLSRQEKGVTELRFNRPCVLASDIAQQFFCEKKVEMQYIHGEVETEAKTIGTEAHEKLLEDTEKVERRKFWQEIYGAKPVLGLEMLFLAKHGDVILAGRPDCVLFQGGFPLWIFEYKFTRSGRPFISHHVQAGTYGILLDGIGFQTHRLFYAITLVDPKARNDQNLKRKVIGATLKNGPKEATLTIENARIYLNKFNKAEAEQDLEWALQFWKNARGAIPTRNPNKCKTCEYNAKCHEPDA
jgi:CRISPR/Cas system-associated exonuclease Cas4 (RecB family)